VTITNKELADNDIRLPELGAPFEWRRGDGPVWIEAALPGSRAAFSTRLGGNSFGAYSSLNLGILTEDDPDLVARNRESLASALGRDPEGIAMGFQVHGADVQIHREPPAAPGYARRAELPKVDAQATDSADVTPLVLAADCVPLALAAPGAAASVHCGWRGVSGGIVARAVETVAQLAGTDPSQVGAALGPAIGSCCYEVGDTVRESFAGRGHGAPTGVTFDLPGAIRIELEWAGVDPGAIADCRLCTSCHPRLFFSHRRDGGVTGRQAGLVWRSS
jgi:purine-nucleoside/S-methyl-5'-thioadenosine phosphorylase / adenosine deaminase